MAVGPYPHLEKVEVDNSRMPRRMPDNRHAVAREIARAVWSRECLSTAYDIRTNELLFYRCPKLDGYPIVFTTLDLDNPFGPDHIDPVERVMRQIHRGKISMRRKLQIVDYAKTARASDADREIDQESEDQRGDMVDYMVYRKETRGMGNHFRRSHLIDQNPLAASK